MMIKAEIFEDKALLLDADGRVWQVTVYAEPCEPVMQLLERIPREAVNRLMRPSLARYVGN